MGVLSVTDCLTIQYNVGDNDISKKNIEKKNYVWPYLEIGSAKDCKKYLVFCLFLKNLLNYPDHKNSGSSNYIK